MHISAFETVGAFETDGRASHFGSVGRGGNLKQGIKRSVAGRRVRVRGGPLRLDVSYLLECHRRLWKS